MKWNRPWEHFTVLSFYFALDSLKLVITVWLCYCYCWAAELCPTLCDPMNWSMPGFPVLHHLLKFVKTHVHCVDDALQPHPQSHPLLSPSPPDFNLSQHQGLFQWVSFSHQMAKVLELQLQHQSFWKVVAEQRSTFEWIQSEATDEAGSLRAFVNKVLLKYKGDRGCFWHRHQKGAERVPPLASLQLDVI